MQKRFVSIWFRFLKTDWFVRRNAHLKNVSFVLAAPAHGRMIVTSANALARINGVEAGITLADARAIIPSLQVLDDKPEIIEKALHGLAEWCIRYTPFVAVDPPAGLIFDATGCSHLWGSEKKYLAAIFQKLNEFGYDVRLAIADTIGAAWAVARFGTTSCIIEKDQQNTALLSLPPESLRIEKDISDRLKKLGLCQLGHFMNISRASLRRRFGKHLLQRLDEASGLREEIIIPVHATELYHERLPCIEPIVTATGIEIALERLLDTLCRRLQKEQKGLRKVLFKALRTDGKVEKISIGTSRPSCNVRHLYKLFQLKIESIEPASGIDLFTLEAVKVEDLSTQQEDLWENPHGLSDVALAELIDKLEAKIGVDKIHRYLPAEHYWPERSCTKAGDILENLSVEWKLPRPRPLQLLAAPEAIEVTAPIPDYPPMLFRYKGILHKIAKADGPERIEQEWWLQQGQHRDYYYVEDEDGYRYWIFRSGHYDAARSYKWYLHGFFA